MKVLSTIALALTSEYYAISIEQAEEFVAGILYGLIAKDDLKLIETCLTDADGVEKEVNEAITDFMKGDIASILAGVDVNVNRWLCACYGHGIDCGLFLSKIWAPKILFLHKTVSLRCYSGVTRGI